MMIRFHDVMHKCQLNAHLHTMTPHCQYQSDSPCIFSVPPNLREVVYPAGIALGGEEEWQFLWEQYFESTDPYEQSLYLTAMAYSTEPWILNR